MKKPNRKKVSKAELPDELQSFDGRSPKVPQELRGADLIKKARNAADRAFEKYMHELT